VDAEETELAKAKSQAEGGEHGRSHYEHKSLEKSRHRHHRDGLNRGPRERVFVRGVTEGYRPLIL
jgi:hypothetical protein